MKLATLRQVVDAQQHDQVVAIVTCLDDNVQSVVSLDTLHHQEHPLKTVLLSSFQNDRSQLVTHDGRKFFIQVIHQPLRLVIVGAVHIAQALIPIAQNCGFSVALVDPRRAFATADRFPDVSLIHDWPDKALADLSLNARTAVLTLTHDPKLDEPALQTALGSEVFYIGALGSRRTHAERCKRLVSDQVSEDQLSRIHAPVGLNIGAVSPAEIAVSIMAQITTVLRAGKVK